MSRANEFLSQKITVLKMNGELNAQIKSQVSPDLRQHSKTAKLPSIKSFSEELTEWPSFFGL